MCSFNLNNYITDGDSGGTWTQIIAGNNSTISIVNGVINTNGAVPGVYTFRYSVSNGVCTSTTDLIVNIITGGILSGSTYCFSEVFSSFLVNIFTASQVSSSTHHLAYQAGSATDVDINLTTGDYDMLEVEPGIYIIEIIPNDDIIDECDCIRTHTIHSIGCIDTELSVDNCIVSWNTSCIQAEGPANVFTLQEFVSGGWVDLTTTSPYNVPAGQSKHLRLKIEALPCIPIYSTEIDVFCDPNLCTTCNLILSQVTQNLVGVLSCGNVISSNSLCTVGDYVIDWYFNTVSPANLIYITGHGTDPDIEVQHPFTGQQAIPTLGGTYIPIIRYIYLNGVLYAPTSYPGALVSPSLSMCLTPIVVQDYTCANGQNVPIPQYTHQISYTANTNFNNATREVRFNYTPGVDLYLAYQICGYSIADRIRFVHVLNNVETILLDIVVGADNASTNLTSTPVLIDDLCYKNILSLPNDAGSYLKIKITPSYNDLENQNTSWYLNLRCLQTFDCDIYPFPGPPTIECVENTVNCTHSISYLTPFNPYYSFISSVGIVIPNSVTIPSGTSCGFPTFGTSLPCNNQTGPTTLTKSGGTFIFSFTDTNAYNEYKAYLQNVISTYLINTVCNDATLPSYYSNFVLNFYLATQCGDTQTATSYNFQYCTSTITYDDSQKTITIVTPTSTLVSSYVPVNSCDYCDNEIEQTIAFINMTRALPNVSNQQIGTIFQGILVGVNRFNNTLSGFGFTNPSIRTYYLTTNVIALFPIDNCICETSPYIIFRSRITVTDTNDVCNNFKIERLGYDAENECTDNMYQLVYQIENGVQTFP